MKFLLSLLVVLIVYSSAEDMLKELDDELSIDLLQHEGRTDDTLKDDLVEMPQAFDAKGGEQTPSSNPFCKIRPNGNYVNPFNCKGFIMCSNHLTYFFDCPSILQYNPKTGRCDWPKYVRCGPTPRPTRPPITPSGSRFCKKRPNGNYVDPRNCNGFIMCSNHFTYFYDCPADLRYNPKTDQCDWPKNVKCGPTPRPTPRPTRPTRPPITPSGSRFCKKRPNGNYVDPRNCNGFIMCSNHFTYFYDCPADLRYNPKTDQCDWPKNVKCGPTPRPTPRPTRPTRPPITPSGSGFCKKRPNGNYVDPRNCNGFIMCSNHFTYFYDCPADLRYNPKTDQCDWPKNVKCGPTPRPTPRPTRSTRPPITPSGSGFCKKRPNGNYVDPRNCNGFIMCSNHFTYFYDCPADLRYNPKTDQCDWPKNVKCGPTPRPTRPPTITPSPSSFCENKPDGNYANPKNCNGFIMCSNHRTFLFKCPADLRYNVKKDQCDWPKNVECAIPLSDSSLSDSSDTKAQRSAFCKRHGDGKYRDVTNCEGYIRCFRGYMFYFECPGFLRFNPQTRRCDLPRNVKCAGAGGGTRGSRFCKRRRNGDYRDRLNCNGFIKCSNGYTYFFDCPSDLRFNERTDRCDWPRNVPCYY